MRVTVYGDSILKGVLLDDGKYVVDHTWETLLSEKFHYNAVLVFVVQQSESAIC